MPTKSNDDAFVPPMSSTTSAKSVGSRHPPRLALRIVSPTSHGSPAHARSSTDSRAVNAS